MFYSFLTGFFLGLSLIVAIGAQNAFVIRQGIIRQHVFYIALFCAASDTLLIILGIAGMSLFFNNLINEFSNIIFGFSALWLFFYGLLRVRSAIKATSFITSSGHYSKSLLNTMSITVALTFGNPHVYLDTMILIGSISQKFVGLNKIFFAIGASISSFVWFFTIAYGAKLMAPIMQKQNHWRILDSFIACIMFFIAFNLASQGNWI
jgi:L-lysine exporter family protein LysE/ArgO